MCEIIGQTNLLVAIDEELEIRHSKVKADATTSINICMLLNPLKEELQRRQTPLLLWYNKIV
ncbi:hypothetical protein AKJ16_DCAP08132 [Drosera capensis]